jgi:hypothetical protein
LECVCLTPFELGAAVAISSKHKLAFVGSPGYCLTLHFKTAD